jgi:SpoVK/Ycf46/Vps4 family AAA+-type ATPase
VPVSYAALSSSFKKAWQQALGQKAPRGVAFHAYCRTVVTTLVDALGASQAAEYTGRTVKTIEAHYKRKRATTQVRSMEVIDRMHAEAAATIDSERDANRNRKSQPGSPEAGK